MNNVLDLSCRSLKKIPKLPQIEQELEELEELESEKEEASLVIYEHISTKYHLTEIYLDNNNLKELPLLPDTVRVLVLSYNNFKEIPILPRYLQDLDLRYNNLTKIEPSLPKTLRSLYINGNNIEKLENLPKSLRALGQNSAKYIDNVRIDSINFNIIGYQSIKRLQLKLKRKFQERKSFNGIMSYLVNALVNTRFIF